MSRRYGGGAICVGCSRPFPKTAQILCRDCRAVPRPCPGCGKPFVTLRENRFCSVTCSIGRFNADPDHQSMAGMGNRRW